MSEKKKTMLVVDDMEMNRDIIIELFTYEFNILSAENGNQALDLLYKYKDKITIVILDLVMPEKDGFSVLREMRANSELQNIPVIVVSASGEVDGELISLELGATDFLVKPVKPYIARLRVQNILAKKEADKLAVKNEMLRKQREEEARYLEMIINAKNDYQYLAEHDQLTGLYNRHMFYKRTREMLDQNKETKFVLVRCDIEKFKVINEKLGYNNGNQLLCEIATELRKLIEPDIGTYARLEADIFVMCFPYSEEKIEAMLAMQKTSRDKQRIIFEYVICFGLYMIYDPSLEVNLMIDRATLAINSIKGNFLVRHAFYNEAMRDALIQQQEIVSDMQSALEQHQFKVFLQPKCDMSTGSIVGSESLVRWFHPTKGMISPGVFIPVFERNAFIMKLDEYIWEETCRVIHEWIQAGKEVHPVSVNISVVNLYNPRLCETIIDLVKKYDIPSELLELEITESAYTDNPKKLIDLLNNFHAYGFKILMDDFGSGYSSLNMLKNIPVDVLKIDLHFLAGSDELGRADCILKSIVNMANDLGLSIIAEGVETQDQADFLMSVGCKKAQGFLYYKPMSVSDYEAVLEKKRDDLNNSGKGSFFTQRQVV